MELLSLLPREFPRHTVVNEVTEGRGKGGRGVFSTGILEGQTACWYMGHYLHHSHVGDGKSHAISVAFQVDHPGHVICGRVVLEVVDDIPAGFCGALINSTEKDSVLSYTDANIQPKKYEAVFLKIIGHDKMHRPVGLAAIPMVATKDIPKGEQLLWSYPVTEETDMTPCDISGIIEEGKALKAGSKKRAIPVMW